MKPELPITIYEAGNTKIPVHIKIWVYEDSNRLYGAASEYIIYFYVQNTEELLFNNEVQNKLAEKIHDLCGILISERIKPKTYSSIKSRHANNSISGEVNYKGYDVFYALGINDSERVNYYPLVTSKNLTLNKIILTHLSITRIENGAGKLLDEQVVLTTLEVVPNEKLINNEGRQQIKLEYTTFFRIKELL